MTLAVAGFIRSVLFLFGMGLALFFSAGTSDFWQGWLFLGVFAIAISGVSLYLLRYDPALFQRRMHAGPTAESRPIEKLIQAITALCWFGILIVAGLDHRFGWSHVPIGGVGLAYAVFLISFGEIFWVLRSNSFAASTIGVEAHQTVITTGPFAYVRHPMYTGALPLIAAMAFALGSAWAALLVIPLLAGLVVRILDEERLLASKLNGYEAYRKSVRWRLVPGIW